MARSNGHNGQAPAAPHWQADPHTLPGHTVPGHGQTQPPLPPGGFAPSPDLPPFAPPPLPSQLAAYVPNQRTQPPMAGAQPGWPQHDPNAYDLGQFGHPQSGPPAQDPYAAAGMQGLLPQPHPPTQHAQQWSPQQHFPSPAAFAEPVPSGRAAYSQPAFANPAHGGAPDYQAYAQPPLPQSHLPPLSNPAPDAGQETYDEDYDDEAFEDEEPRRGRKLMVVGALVGAICVGAGLAYAYRAFSGGKTPLVAQKATAAKTVAAAQPPKPPVKLPEAVPVQAVAAATAPEDGVRRVTSIVIPPPGSAQAPASAPPPQSAPVMPGMILDGPSRTAVGGPPQTQPAAPLRPSAVPNPVPVPPPAQAVAPPPPPSAKAATKVAVLNPPAAPVATAPQAAPPAERKAAPVPKAKANDAFTPTAAPGAASAATAAAPAAKTAASGGGNGYVATVLSTQKGRPDAMKAFADLQQKFPNVLGAKPAEVQEKDLGDKGVWFRAVVGPPGSRAAASEVCTQLKASGYGQCFVTAY